MERVIKHLKEHKSEVEQSLRTDRDTVKSNSQWMSRQARDAAQARIDENIPYLTEIDQAIKKLKG